MRFDPWRWLAALTLGGSILLQGCTSLPPLDGRVASTHIAPAADSQLGRSITPLTASQPGLSGVVPLLRGGDAFAARIRLADAAERSLDVQYYIWHKDLSGTLLADALRRAADRGVRVRILLDDNNTSGLDAPLAGLARHPNMEVRLFNPFLSRQGRPLGFLFDFDRLNRRMHNKSFTADNLATIVGGRNVGDEYFDAGQDFLFVDLDALAIGPIVDAVSRDFDRYWASDSSYPVESIVPAIDPSAAADLARAAAQIEQSAAAIGYRAAVDASPFVRDLIARRLPIEWANVRLVSDDPAKGLGEAGADGLLWSQLMKATRDPERNLKLISPYFVPGADGTHHLATLARRGVKVQVLTNSLEATDVAAVHAGYAKRRKDLLAAGVSLFEIKRLPSMPSPARSLGGSSGVSSSSLHAKTFSIDDAQLFIGSFNFDPRSARLNTEMGFVIDSPALARSIADSFARDMPSRAYEVRLTPDGALQWIDRSGGSEVIHLEEPGATVWKRFVLGLLSWLPIEWLL